MVSLDSMATISGSVGQNGTGTRVHLSARMGVGWAVGERSRRDAEMVAGGVEFIRRAIDAMERQTTA